MYNIHSHYENIFSLAQKIWGEVKVVYLFPFGATSVENIEYLNSGDNGPILLCYDQEPLIPGFNDPIFDYVFERFVHNEHNRVLLLNTEYNSDAKNYFMEKYDLEDVYYFFHIFAAHDWFRGYRYCPDIIKPDERKVNKKFISFNRITGNARSYRSLHVADLARRNLLDYGHISYSTDCPEHGNSIEQLAWARDNYSIDVDWAVKELASVPELRIDTLTGEHIPNGSMVLSAVHQCMESFLFVVTETEYWTRKCHLTEKIFKPIIGMQPFVLLGPAHNLAYLKSYGFLTFDRWWDESYDSIEDPVERLLAVNNVIANLCMRSNEELEQMLDEMQEILLHNRRWFESTGFLDSAWNEFEERLRDYS